MGHSTSRSFLVLSFACMFAAPAFAANRFFVENKELILGATGETLHLLCDADIPVYGFVMAVKYEPAKLKVTKLELVGEAADSEWLDLKFNNTTGEILIGVVPDLSPENDLAKDNEIPVGTNIQLVKVTADVIAAAAGATFVDYRDELPNDPKKMRNILANSGGIAISPAQEDRNVTIKSLAPVIQSLANNRGKAGDTFSAQVTNLDPVGLAIQVEVCGTQLVRDAANGFQLLADKRTLEIVAPACGSLGFAPLKVTTPYGSATSANGFDYLKPIITTIIGNEGKPGKVFQVIGQNFNRPGLAVRVCGTGATATLRADNATIDVTAPACVSGWALLEVITNDGSDSDVNGFNYLPDVTKTFIRGDANNDLNLDLADPIAIFGDLFLGNPSRADCRDQLDSDDTGVVDITDGIYLLNYLFLGGSQPRDPYPLSGLDPTNDDLPACI